MAGGFGSVTTARWLQQWTTFLERLVLCVPVKVRPFVPYLVTVALVAAGWAAEAVLTYPIAEADLSFTAFVLAVVAASVGGLRPGLFAVALAAPVAVWAFYSPRGDLVFSGEQAMLLVSFLGAGALIALVVSTSVGMVSSLRRANVALDMLSRIGLELEQSESLREAIERAAGIPVPSFADVVIIDWFHDGAFERFAVGRSDIRGATTSALRARQHPPDASNPEDPRVRVLTSGQPLRGKLDTRFDPWVAPGSWIMVPLTAGGERQGVVTFVAGTQRHVYDERDAEVARELGRRLGLRLRSVRIAEELREANRAKDTFLGMISHELRTPMTIFAGYTETLQRRWDELSGEELHLVLGEMSRQSDQMQRLIENMLVTARTRERRLEVMELEPVLLHHAIGQMASDQAMARGREIRVDASVRVPPVLADPQYLRQILQNLISNADKYSPPGRPIVVRTAQEGEMVRVCVEDEGPGVPEEERARIFEPFGRRDEHRGVAGVGLGLAVCRLLSEAMGGSIGVDARPGGGSSFWFTLRAISDAYGESEGSGEERALSLEHRP